MSKAQTSPRVLKFATIGCGRISDKHLAALTAGKLPVELVAVCDLVEEKAKAKAEQYGGVPYYLDYHEMIKAHPEVDVINVLTPSGYHVDHVVDIAPYGKNIICEKPMALRVEDCDKMIAACQRSGSRLFIVKQNRFNPAIQAARGAMDSGRFGKMVSASVCVRWRRDQRYYDQADWRGTWAYDGGVLSQQATHHLDLMQWFMGPVETVSCQIATRLMNIEVEDTAAAILKFRSGALGLFEATVATRPVDICGTLSLLGEHGTVIVGGIAVNEIEFWKFEQEKPEDGEMSQKFSQQVSSVYGHGHLPYIAEVVDAILNNRAGLVEGAEGKKNIEILTALYESAALGGAPVVPGAPVTHARIGVR